MLKNVYQSILILTHHRFRHSGILHPHPDTPIHIALRNKGINIEIIQIMIQTCPTILSTPNKEGLLPLHVGCRYCFNRSDIIELVASSYPKACFVHIKVSYRKEVTVFLSLCIIVNLCSIHDYYIFIPLEWISSQKQKNWLCSSIQRIRIYQHHHHY